jgi:hypothetical protein
MRWDLLMLKPTLPMGYNWGKQMEKPKERQMGWLMDLSTVKRWRLGLCSVTHSAKLTAIPMPTG